MESAKRMEVEEKSNGLEKTIKKNCLYIYDLLAVLKEKQSYDVLSVGLSDLIKEMEELSKTIKVDDNIYEIEYFLCGDWKFLASVFCGIGAANREFKLRVIRQTANAGLTVSGNKE
jgi:hypothetical protein